MKKLISFIGVLGLVLGLVLFSPNAFAATVTTLATADVSSDSTGTGTSVSLPNIVVTEAAAGEITTGLKTWTIPTGYVFDTTSIANVAYTGTGLAGTATVTFLDNTTFTVNITASSTATGTMTIGDTTPIKVRASAGTPMASPGNITMTGGTITGITTTTNFGTLTQVVGAANKLAITVQPSSPTVANTPFVTQPVVTIQDQFGNTRTADIDTITLAAFSNSACTAAFTGLGGTLTKAAVAGVANFSANGVKFSVSTLSLYLKASTGTLVTACTTPALTVYIPKYSATTYETPLPVDVVTPVAPIVPIPPIPPVVPPVTPIAPTIPAMPTLPYPTPTNLTERQANIVVLENYLITLLQQLIVLLQAQLQSLR